MGMTGSYSHSYLYLEGVNINNIFYADTDYYFRKVGHEAMNDC